MKKEVLHDAVTWSGNRGVLNLFPGFEVASVLDVAPVTWLKDQVKFAVYDFDLSKRTGSDETTEVHLVALSLQKGKYRCLQWSQECVVAVNQQQHEYSLQSLELSWSVKVNPNDTKYIHYIDKCFSNRVDHDPVPVIHGLAFFEIVKAATITDHASLVSTLEPSLEHRLWEGHKDADEVSCDELLRITDSFSAGLITTPVRSTAPCSHAQCFDFSSLISTYFTYTTRGFRCPVCLEPIDLKDIVFDTTFSNWLKSIPAGDIEPMKRRATSINPAVYVSFGYGNGQKQVLPQVQAFEEEVVDDCQGPIPLPMPMREVMADDPSLIQQSSDRVLEVGKVTATLVPSAEAGHPNTFFLGLVRNVDLQLSSVNLSELKENGDGLRYSTTSSDWTENILSLAPVSGRWSSDDRRIFILADGEPERLQNMQLDMT